MEMSACPGLRWLLCVKCEIAATTSGRKDHEISNDRTHGLVDSFPPEPNLQRVGNQSDSRTFTGPDRPFTQPFSTVTQTFSTVTGHDCTGTYCAQIAA